MPSATAATSSADPSIPDFTACGGRSSASASSCCVTSVAGSGSHARTPTVFCAVTAVMTLVPAGLRFRGAVVAPGLGRTAGGTALVAGLGRHAVPVEQATARVFASLADTETPQGIIAVVEPRAWTLADIAWSGGGGGGAGAALVIDAVQDPGNVGTLIRTAHALGAAGTIALRGTADPLSPKALRAAMGATFRHPVVPLDDPRFIAWTRQHGVTLWAAAADG